VLTVRQKRCLRKGLCSEKKSKEKIYRLRGGDEVVLEKPYSLKKRGKFIDLLRDREKISFFYEGVDPVTIERYASGYEFSLRRRKNLVKKGGERY